LLWELNLHGHFDVAVLNGQFPAWTAAGGAVSVDPPPVEPAFFVSQFQPHLLATNHSIADIMGDQGYVIVDNRVYDQYAGTVPGPGIAPERAGHIPGVLHWVAADYYAAGFFMPVDEFVAKAVARGITKDKNIIVTCRSGHSATALYILLSAAGFNNVALHDHSWLGWNIEDYLPRARK
jgi:thiosulfate/3-mercaptopyruvate sulfurtransferase